MNKAAASSSGALSEGNAAILAEELRHKVRGEVRFDSGSRALYASDASNYRAVPIGIVIPHDLDALIETVRIARKHGAPILSRGAGTSLAGQCCNVALVIDTSKYFHDFIALDVEKRLATARPGIVLDNLRARAARHGLTFGPDPATHNRCTIGGMIGNNSCGVHSVMAQFAGTGARTSDNLEALEILTYDGLRMRVGKTTEQELANIVRGGGPRADIYRKLKALRDKYAPLIRERFPKIPRRVSGYNLDDLLPENGFHVARALVGTEGTCVTILEATLQLIPDVKARSLLVLGYADIFQAGDHCPEIMSHKPIGLEGFDNEMVDMIKEHNLHTDELKLLPKGGGWLMVEFGGQTKEEADNRARQLMIALKKTGAPPEMKLYDDPAAAAKLWAVRESALGVTAFAPGQRVRWPGWEDSAVPPHRIGHYLRDLKKLFARHNYDASVYGHFGQGLVHCRLPFEFETPQGRQKFRAFLDDAADLVVSYGGSISGEHGDGQARAALLPKMFGDELI
ncbi:MAG: FAD-binding oxidoreductase, partial [Chthoniobacterales bacterium]